MHARVIWYSVDEVGAKVCVCVFVYPSYMAYVVYFRVNINLYTRLMLYGVLTTAI